MFISVAMVAALPMRSTWLRNFLEDFMLNRQALPAEALHCNTSYLTAVANDYVMMMIYSRLIEGIGDKGDVLIGLSTSGNSENILKAFEIAREKEMVTIGFTGAQWWKAEIDV